MKPQTLLKKLIILTALSVIHIGLSVILYEARNWLSIIPLITALINSWVLLKYFAYTIHHVLAHRLAKKHPVNTRFVINIMLGIITNALLIYSLFVMVIAHAAIVIEWM
jgi:hypothetical protein